MLDAKLLRTQTQEIADRLARKKYRLDVDALQQRETQRKAVQGLTESLQNDRNQRSKEIGKTKAAGEDITPLVMEMDEIKRSLAALESELKRIQDEFTLIASGIPNLPDDDVPPGESEADNVVVRSWGEPTRFAF